MNNKGILGLAALALLVALPVRATACSQQQVRLHLQKNEIRLTPPEAKCVVANGGFDIIILPPGAEGRRVWVEEKGGVPITIKGDNTDDPDVVAVSVTGTADPNIDYGYIVHVEGHGNLDPEVRVVGSSFFMQSLMSEVDTLLQEELGISLQDFNDLQTDYARPEAKAK